MARHLRAMIAALLLISAPAAAAQPACTIVKRTPSALTVRIQPCEPGALYRVTYRDGKHQFTWDNLSPDPSGLVVLTDDKHLQPKQRLQCASRLSAGDPVVFDDWLKAPVVGKRRGTFGVPVSTFGGPGYLVPGVSELKRDDYGNFWLYLHHPPYALLKYDHNFVYQFALLMPDRVLAFDTDAEGNLYVLHPDNWISKHSPLGENLAAWDLPVGREPGEFISASGMVIDRAGGFIYLSDERLGRVQRFSLDLELRPIPHIAWGWIGREDLEYTEAGKYDPDHMYYQLDRPRQLALDGEGHLYVSCEHYISKFDLATGRQLPFGKHPVLGWGGSFTDSPFSQSAGLDGHWARQWLAGVDGLGDIYIGDRENDFVVFPRLQVFAPDGTLIQSLDIEDEVQARDGRPVYIRGVAGLAADGARVWLVDAAGRIYANPPAGKITSGGQLFLGPGAAGRQFDLTQVKAENLSVEMQEKRVIHRSEGRVLGFLNPEQGTGNCEREGVTLLESGERSMWLPSRIGEPFRVRLYDESGGEIPVSDYFVEFEERPGLFGTQYDYFRVTNRSGKPWRNVRFVAEAKQ